MRSRRLVGSLIVVAVSLVAATNDALASTVDPVDPAASAAIEVTFACAADQTPELVVPIRDYDETFPAGTASTTFDFETLEFADTRILIDCTPYDDADIECFEVAPIADAPDSDPTLQTRPLDPADCAFIGPRPLDTTTTVPQTTEATTTTSAPTTTTPPTASPAATDTLPGTGASTDPIALAVVLTLLGGAFLVVVRARGRPAPAAGRDSVPQRS